MDAHDWPTHLGNGGVIGLVEEWWDSSQFDYEAGAAWWLSVFSARFLPERRGFDPRSFHQGVKGLYVW